MNFRWPLRDKEGPRDAAGLCTPTIGDIVRLGDDHALEREVWLVVHTDVKDVPVIRAVVDAIKNAFDEERSSSRM